MNKDKLHMIKSRVLWTLAMGMIAFLLVASIQRKSQSKLDHIVVAIKPIKGDNNLIEIEDVDNKFRAYLGFDLQSAQVQDLDLMEMETLLNEDYRVKMSHLFIDGQNRLNIWIVQRQPLVRVLDGAISSYYIDDEGKKLETVPNKAIRVPIATGHIELYQDSLLKSGHESRLRAVFDLASFIQQDELLSAMIEQIDVGSNNDIVLIPKIGRQELTFGDAEDLQDKFENLKIFYKDGLPREGWRKFSSLNLSLKGQVVAKLNK